MKGAATYFVILLLVLLTACSPTLSYEVRELAEAAAATQTVTSTVVVPSPEGEPGATATADVAPPPGPEPFGRAVIEPDFELDGEGQNVDSLAFWEAPDPGRTLLFVTAKNNQLVEVWRFPFVENELPPLTDASFGDNTQVNGVAVDQDQDQLFVVVSRPVSTVSRFQLPQLNFAGQLVAGAVDLENEPNIALLRRPDGGRWAYISSTDTVYVYDTVTGAAVDEFAPATGLETMLADPFYQVIYIPDENDRSGVYAYKPDGTPYEQNGSQNFGDDQFDSDAEGILLYRCLGAEGADTGRGFIVVSDQKQSQTEFEIFDRQSWTHLGTLELEGVANTDGIASTQRPLPGYPLGIFVAVNDDATTAGVSWQKILNGTGLNCGPTIGLGEGVYRPLVVFRP